MIRVLQTAKRTTKNTDLKTYHFTKNPLKKLKHRTKFTEKQNLRNQKSKIQKLTRWDQATKILTWRRKGTPFSSNPNRSSNSPPPHWIKTLPIQPHPCPLSTRPSSTSPAKTHPNSTPKSSQIPETKRKRDNQSTGNLPSLRFAVLRSQKAEQLGGCEAEPRVEQEREKWEVVLNGQ